MILTEYFNTIRKLYPNVVTVDETEGAFDVEGNLVEIDTSLVRDSYDEDANIRALKRLRINRNELLEETDWMANSDVTMSDEWRAYRQVLRDLPANTTDPANPVWPTKPS